MFELNPPKKDWFGIQGIELVEAEFTSLFLSMMAIFDRHPEYKVQVILKLTAYYMKDF